MSSYTLSSGLRIEFVDHNGRSTPRTFLGEGTAARELPRTLFPTLLALLSGKNPGPAGLAALEQHGVLIPSAVFAPDPKAHYTLGQCVAIDAAPSSRQVGDRSVFPQSSLPISLFMPPPLLHGLQRMSGTLRNAFSRLCSAALSRGQGIDAAATTALLTDLAAELWQDDALLQQYFTVAGRFQLVPRGPLQDSQIHFPIETLRFLPDRNPCDLWPFVTQVPAGAPLGETLADHGRLIGQLAAGISGESLRQSAATPALLRLLSGLAGSAALEIHSAPSAANRLAPPRGTVMHLGHATLLANLDDHFLLIDPWLPPASRTDALLPPSPAALPPLAGILITHHHWDHVHIETLLKLDKAVPVYIPCQPEGLPLSPRTDLLLRYLGFQRVIPLAHGEQLRFGATGTVVATPFYGEDPVCLGYGGNCYLLCQDGRAALVHVDSGSDIQGRSLATTGEARELARRYGPLSPIFATRRQEKGIMIEHSFEFLLQSVERWSLPTENCCNDGAFLAALCRESGTNLLVLYSEGGADWYPASTDFLRRQTPTARRAPHEYLWEPLSVITDKVHAAGAAIHLSQPYQIFRIGGGHEGA